MICPSCSVENPPAAKFCIECGTPLALRCPECATPHAAGQKFCAECGAPLAGSERRGPAGAGPAARVVPELRFVSVLFIDLVGFTTLSEGRQAEDVRELLGRYFASARTVVERYGGTIGKFIGDAVMAVWGTPVAHEDDAERAVRAALEIVDAVQVFGEEHLAPDLSARAGVVTGRVASLENPSEGLVVGDRVNTASRVQTAAEPGTVLVDEVTRQVTSAAIAYEDAGEHTVKGKAEPLHLWRAARVVAGVRGTDREQGVEAPFLGRDAELRLVKELLHATVERSSARLVAISGEPGIGKSRLRRELSNYLDGLADTFLWHLGRCLSHGDGVAYWALAEMVRQRLGIPEDATVSDASEKLEAGLGRWVPDEADRAFLIPRLGALIGVAEPGLDRAELFAGWRLFFERLAVHEPVVLVFEDMQWADEGLLEFIGQTLDWSMNVPIFMVVLARPDLAAKREGWPAGRRGATTVQLEPLDDTAMRRLLAGLVDGLPGDAVSRIVERAQGIPLYAIETVRALADRGVLTTIDGKLAAGGELGELEVPASLNALLTARIDALDPAERTVVKMMSVFGGSFPREAALALSELPEDELDAALVGLVRKQVLAIRADPLSPDRGQYAFAQGMLRTVAYELLSRHERKQRHLAAAEHLRGAFPNDGEEVAEVIATHYLDAYRAAGDDRDATGLRERAVAALRRAAQRAATVGAPDAAQRSYITACELVSEAEQAPLLRAAGEMATQAGRVEDAVRLLRAASDAYARSGEERESALVAFPMAASLRALGRHREAADRITAALATIGADRESDPDIGRLNAVLGRVLLFAGDSEHAAPAIESALAIGQALELPDVFGEALSNKAMLCDFAGRAQEARYLYAAAIDVAERYGLAEILARAQTNAGYLSMLWDLPDAARYLEAATTTNRRRGDRYGESVSAGNAMTLHLFQGRWDECERMGDELLSHERPGAEHCRYPLCHLYAARGEIQRVTEAVAGLSGWRDVDDSERRTSHDSCLVVLRLLEGRDAEALDHGLSVLEPAGESLGELLESVRHCWAGTLQAALRLGRHDDARRVIELITNHPPGLVPPALRLQARRGQALLAAATGRHDQVEDDLTAVIAGFDRIIAPYWRAITQTDLAAWLIEQHRATEAASLLEQATGVFEQLRAAPALDRARELARAASSTPA